MAGIAGLAERGSDVVAGAGRRAEVVARLRAAGCVFAEDEARVLLAAAGTPVELEAMVARRVEGEPLEYIVGWAEFCGLRIAVAPGVFVPRRRTEALVREAARLVGSAAGGGAPELPEAPAPGGGAIVVDLCCGTGAIAAALAARVPGLRLVATDIDPAAVRCAEANLAGTGAQVLAGDLFSALPAQLAGRVSLVVANAPYVPSSAIATMPREARDHERRAALDGGSDGTDLHRRISAEAPAWLARGGHLLIEVGRDQATTTARYLAEAGFAVRIVEDDECDATVVIGEA